MRFVSGVRAARRLRRQLDAWAGKSIQARLDRRLPRKKRAERLTQQGHAALSAGRIAEARRCASRADRAARKAGANPVAALKLSMAAGRAAHDLGAFSEAARRLREDHGHVTPALLREAINAHLELQDWDAVRRLGPQLRALEPAHPGAMQAEYIALLATTERDRIVDAFHDWVFGDDGGPELLMKVKNFVTQDPKTRDDLHKLARKSQRRWPDAPEVARFFERLGLKYANTLHTAAARATNTEADDKKRPKDFVRSKLTRFLATNRGNRASADEIVEALAQQMDFDRLRRPVVLDDGTSDILVSEKGDVGATVLVFSGIGGVLSLPIEAIDACMAALGLRAVYVRDPSHLLFLAGISTLGEGFEKTADALRARLPTEDRLFCLGFSAGCFGALQYGAALQAQKVICFGASTNASPEFVQTHRDRRVIILLDRLNDAVPQERLATRKVLGKAAHRPDIRMVFSEDNRIDRAHAEDVATLPNVALHPIPAEKGHAALYLTVVRGEFVDHLRWLVE